MSMLLPAVTLAVTGTATGAASIWPGSSSPPSPYRACVAPRLRASDAMRAGVKAAAANRTSSMTPLQPPVAGSRAPAPR